MSSSDKFPDWSAFSKREIPFEVELLSPASEAAALLQRSQAALDEAWQEVDHVRGEGLAALAQQAALVIQLAATLERYQPDFTQASLKKVYRSLQITKDQMLDELRRVGLEIIVPLGKTFDEVAQLVNVDGWRHQEHFTSEVVAEVIEPIVMYRNILVRPGRVVMGAPLEQKTTTSP
jgi:molecular chaperone GrpE (heat shock protein)